MPPELQPILAAVLSVVALIVLVTRLRVHPFLGLLVASLMLGFLAGLVPADIIKNFGKGFGENPPDLASVLITILLPPVLMLGRSVVELA